jgi:hypothetical protein
VKFFSAYAFFTRALLILALFAILHLLGWRDYTSFISGTTSGGINDIFGIAYFIMYSLALYLAPVLLIASAIFVLITRLAKAEP